LSNFVLAPGIFPRTSTPHGCACSGWSVPEDGVASTTFARSLAQTFVFSITFRLRASLLDGCNGALDLGAEFYCFEEGKEQMSSTLTPLPDASPAAAPEERHILRRNRHAASPTPFRFPSYALFEHEEAEHRQAELFYLQKQIQSQTPMVIVLEDGEHIEGCIEWYDRHALKVRGRSRVLIYKSAIKYMYKHGENGGV
jgi:sRNA-binding regulator protein Hfq